VDPAMFNVVYHYYATIALHVILDIICRRGGSRIEIPKENPKKNSSFKFECCRPTSSK
jgi:hypothetical protein